MIQLEYAISSWNGIQRKIKVRAITFDFDTNQSHFIADILYKKEEGVWVPNLTGSLFINPISGLANFEAKIPLQMIAANDVLVNAQGEIDFENGTIGQFDFIISVLEPSFNLLVPATIAQAEAMGRLA
jgi:hypothetical protein